jgi:hypothetical protein
MYAISKTMPVGAKVDTRFATNTFLVDTHLSSALFHSEYTLTVRLPEGNYQSSAVDLNFTENDHISNFSDHIYTQKINGGNIGADVDLNDPAQSLEYSEMIVPGHRYGYTRDDRDRTYIEALQKAIRKAQQNVRYQALTGSDGLGSVLISWTDPASVGITPVQLLANENYKNRILRFIVSDMSINVFANANHQPEFSFRTNMTHSSSVGTNGTVFSQYLGNLHYFAPFPIVVGAASGLLTSAEQVNPWISALARDGQPSHFVQCRITAPNNVRFKGRSVSNCLDFYVDQYINAPTTTPTLPVAPNSRILVGDIHSVAAATPIERAGGNFTPYGYTWTTHPISNDRTDVFKPFTIQDGQDGWFACCYFGIRKAASPTTMLNTVSYVYMPVFYNNNTYLSYVCDVDMNQRMKNSLPKYGPQTLHPVGGAAVGVAANNELISDFFSGVTVTVSSSSLPTLSTVYIGPANFGRSFINKPTMDYESVPTFIIEIEMFGTGNHMKFTGSGECKRVKVIKRMTLNELSYSGFLKNNTDGQQTLDYGSCLGLSKVSSIRCRVLNEQGEVIRLPFTDSFPHWTFSLGFEC